MFHCLQPRHLSLAKQKVTMKRTFIIDYKPTWKKRGLSIYDGTLVAISPSRSTKQREPSPLTLLQTSLTSTKNVRRRQAHVNSKNGILKKFWHSLFVSHRNSGGTKKREFHRGCSSLSTRITIGINIFKNRYFSRLLSSHSEWIILVPLSEFVCN